MKSKNFNAALTRIILRGKCINGCCPVISILQKILKGKLALTAQDLKQLFKWLSHLDCLWALCVNYYYNYYYCHYHCYRIVLCTVTWTSFRPARYSSFSVWKFHPRDILHHLSMEKNQNYWIKQVTYAFAAFKEEHRNHSPFPPPRAANSHSASVGSLLPTQVQYSSASL